ncbi:alpha-ketoacid dehydrogenase subunit alpha/beta [Neolewinella aurantiaca]|uniref:alpha-ketoacid dehydrogenase subunit alpha/beta n=1 Tax=Neolewinella aurantiaca TaxID=2602767 RepID=UPI001FEA9C2E|nr:alpha-ketoacid dehydrogenase subunit alpha/beta [Neolewinella aurantiaca]
MPTKNPELKLSEQQNTPESLPNAALRDYHICRVSRELSNVIRRDVLTGRAKFGVSDDGKELYQVAMARAIKNGDWRADYYRGHTLLLALEIASVEDILAQLYADAKEDPFSVGRSMVGHHATPFVDHDGNWLDHLAGFNISSATSPTAGQMARGLGLAFASKKYRSGEGLPSGFSDNGNEIAWTEIGDASTSEGVFWETLNAAGVLQVPMITTVVDDGFGISVPVEKQTTKGSISKALAGLKEEKGETGGIEIHHVHGWDYPALTALYPSLASRVRATHRAAVVHLTQLTQPNGHSTSGSHERYKSKERLAWEKEFDCLVQFRHWMIATGVAEASDLDEIDKRAKKEVMAARKNAWDRLNNRLKKRRNELVALFPTSDPSIEIYNKYKEAINRLDMPNISELIDEMRRLRLQLGQTPLLPQLQEWLRDARRELKTDMGSHLLSETPKSPVRLPALPPKTEEGQPTVPAYELLQKYFTAKFENNPALYAFGEDVGHIGDVNQGFAGLQLKFGEDRIFDTGIREWSIVGQAMGMSMRGLRPIVEIQYLDYIFYALPLLTDDIATLRWRTGGTQACPLIVRTRGHRLEGIWHSGSYLAPLINSLRGIHLCVPRNMTQAAGMYNTLLQGDDPAIVIEVLNGYRLHETVPQNLTDFRVPLGVPECLRPGTDLTIVTYGACVKICLEAAELLASRGIDAEVIDVQTLMPFDLEHRLADHLSRTNRLLIVDEDAPGGTSAFIRQQILEVQEGYQHLDGAVKTLTAAMHRPPYGDDGDYAGKPQVMDVVEASFEVVEF